MKRKLILSILILVIAVAVIGVIRVSATTGYSLDWGAVAGGGITTSTGGNYSLGATIGQPAAGTSAGGAYHLIGGFWAVTQQLYERFLPLIMH